MAFFRDPGEMFLGCLGTVEQRYLVNLIKNAAKNGYTRFVEPCAGTFAMSNLAIQNGYKPEQIETSDVSMMSSVMGYAITGKPLDELEIHAQGFSDEELLDPAVALYAQMYLRTSKTAGNEYFFNLLKDLRDRREEHIEHIRQSLENIKKEMYGMTYRPLDMWDHLDEVLDDPHTLVIANPPTYFSGYEKFYDTQGKMTWKEPEYKLFDPETGHVELFDRCMNANALVVCYQEKRTGEAVGEPIFARAGTRADLNSYITSNRGEEAAALAEGRKIKRPSESKLAPIACSMLPRDYEITEKSKVAKTGRITPTAEWQLKQAKQSGALMDDVIREVGVLTGKSDTEILRLFQDAGLSGMLQDAKPLLQAGKLKTSDIVLSGAMQRTMEAAAEKCRGEIGNLTLTTAIATQQEYMQTLNAAYMKVTSGAFSYQEAIRQAIRDAAVKGTSVMYDSGYISKLDTAIRTALLTGVNQTAGKLTELYASELGAEYYETTAHAGARPSHSVWQGKVFKIEGTAPGYENFYEATGYGTGAGLCGWNCRHSFYPYWPGISKPAYTKDDLEDYSRPKYSFAGNLLTEYECMQKQREYERAVREYKRILAAYDSYIQTVQSEADRAYFREEFQKESVKLKEKESQMKDFCKQTGRSVDTARTQVSAVHDGNGNLVSFNRSVSGKAVWANKKAK